MSSRAKRTVPASAGGMRLNRYIARSGRASRRSCDDGIRNGLVTVNGKLEINPAFKVSQGDTVLWDGSAVVLPEIFVAAMNKPVGYETTMETGNKRSVSVIAEGMPGGAAPVGRLDIKTGGLLLWSNDGELVYRLTHPRWKVQREYTIVTGKPVVPDFLKRLRKGSYIEPGVYSKPMEVRQTGRKAISVVLRTGRNREVRRLALNCGVPLSGLERTRYGNISLDDLPRGTWRGLTGEEIQGLRRLAGFRN